MKQEPVFPKISVVTPSFNQGRYIEQTICSVLDQGYPNLEYIIIDGGSTDDTVEIVRKYKRYLTYWVSEPDRGQTDALNKGFAKCSGDVFNWLNSDDFYEPGTFEKLAGYFSNPGVDVVCGTEWGFETGNPQQRTKHPGSLLGKDHFESVRIGIIDQPCTFFRRRKIAPFFPLHQTLRYVMDKQLWWQYLLQFGHQGILKVEDSLTLFRLHPASKSVAENSGFEREIEALKRSLFQQLRAPEVLLRQVVPAEQDLNISWPVQPGEREKVLAAFASWYAERQYVKKNRGELQELTDLLKQWKGRTMTAKEWKWWLVAHCLPVPAFNYLRNRVPA